MMRFQKGILFIVTLAVLSTSAMSWAALHQPPKANDSSVVIVIILGNDEISRQRNDRFVTELKLALDGFTIKRIETGVDDFPELTLQERIERIRPFATDFNAVATVWIEETGTGATLLNLVALSTGRALVRIVEAKQGPGTETELALAAQELLGEAYLFHPPTQNTPVERIVTRVKREVIEQEPRKKGETKVVSLFDMRGGIFGQEGPSLLLGGEIGAEPFLTDNIHLRISAAFLARPRQREGDGLVVGWQFEPHVLAGYFWQHDKFNWGPFADFAVSYSKVDMTLGTGENRTFNWWNGRGSLGLGMQIHLTYLVDLLLEPSLGTWPLRKKYTRFSDNRVVFTTPFIDWNLRIGLAFSI